MGPEPCPSHLIRNPMEGAAPLQMGRVPTSRSHPRSSSSLGKREGGLKEVQRSRALTFDVSLMQPRVRDHLWHRLRLAPPRKLLDRAYAPAWVWLSPAGAFITCPSRGDHYRMCEEIIRSEKVALHSAEVRGGVPAPSPIGRVLTDVKESSIMSTLTFLSPSLFKKEDRHNTPQIKLLQGPLVLRHIKPKADGYGTEYATWKANWTQEKSCQEFSRPLEPEIVLLTASPRFSVVFLWSNNPAPHHTKWNLQPHGTRTLSTPFDPECHGKSSPSSNVKSAHLTV
ncbi:hypothetical protein P7K49_032057 [Saguinus oedipus]|uniref:Uncharacterized protein n=1 Tax=Saguinus oedipus TaxID=9490 RepID=A0ABQ9TXT4_SAGOE|nr:hypothetical protein P7K49_032057 [Saguinus oedipus]